MGYFDGLRDAKVFEKGTKMEPRPETLALGQCKMTDTYFYKLKVLRTFVKPTREFGDAFIADFEILETDSPHKVGTEVSWFQSLQKKDIAFGAIKEFFYGVGGVDLQDKEARAVADKTIEKEMSDAVEKNSIAGEVVYVTTSLKLTKEKKQPFTNHAWRPAKAA